MRVATMASPPLTRAHWLDWLRLELAPAPGRWETTIRLVVAVVLVTIISMSLGVPEAAISAYMVFFVTKENRVLTALTGLLLILGVTVAIAASLLLFKWTLDFPALRFVTIAASLFVGMYLSRAFVVGPLGFAIGFVMSAAQSFVDGAPDSEIAVRSLLWLWVVVVYPIALTVVINRFLLPIHPHAVLRQALTRRLDAALGALRRILGTDQANEKAHAALVDMVTRGSAPLLKLAHFAKGKNAAAAPHHAIQSEAIIASERLATAAAAMEARVSGPLDARDRPCAETLLTEITQLRNAISKDGSIQPSDRPASAVSDSAELREIDLATAALRDTLEGKTGAPPYSSAPPKPAAKKSLFVADAFINPAHVYFALKVTLAAMACYVIYTGLDWSGIHTAFITCCFIALESTGATTRKASLRLGGCIVGGLLGFGSILYLVPHMESITSLVLLIAAVSALAGWVAAGSERIAYAGLQIALAFYLSIFQGFAPATDLHAIRDRVAGIILGILVVSLVFGYLWPERTVDRLRTAAALALRNLARLIGISHQGETPESFTEECVHRRAAVTSSIAECLRLAELADFENVDPNIPSQPDLSQIVCLTSGIQDLYITSTALINEASFADWMQLSESEQKRDNEWRKAVADRIDSDARSIEEYRFRHPYDDATTIFAVPKTNFDWPDEPAFRRRNELIELLASQANHTKNCIRVREGLEF